MILRWRLIIIVIRLLKTYYNKNIKRQDNKNTKKGTLNAKPKATFDKIKVLNIIDIMAVL